VPGGTGHSGYPTEGSRATERLRLNFLFFISNLHPSGTNDDGPHRRCAQRGSVFPERAHIIADGEFLLSKIGHALAKEDGFFWFRSTAWPLYILCKFLKQYLDKWKAEDARWQRPNRKAAMGAMGDQASQVSVESPLRRPRHMHPMTI
jgi:hypothetical protein